MEFHFPHCALIHRSDHARLHSPDPASPGFGARTGSGGHPAVPPGESATNSSAASALCPTTS